MASAIADTQEGWVYLLRCGWHYKVGFSRDVKKRVYQLQTANPYRIELILATKCKHARHLETFIHNFFDKYQVSGEWYEFPPASLDEIMTFMKDVSIDGIFDDDIDTHLDTGDEECYSTYMMPDFSARTHMRKGLFFDGEVLFFNKTTPEEEEWMI